MNDQDRQLLQSLLQTAGEAGQRGFSYMLHYTITDAIVGVFATLAELAFAVFLAKKLYAWKPKGFDEDIGYLVRGLGLLACAIFALIGISCIGSNFTALFAPEGATLHSMLSHVH